MSKVNHEFIHNASLILGVIVILVCLYDGGFPAKYKTITLFMIPAILITNYYCLIYLAERKKL